MEYEAEGPRPRGRPKRTWREVVEKDCQACNLNKEDDTEEDDTVDCSRWTGTHARMHARTHTHLFNGPLPGTIRVSQYQRGETNLDFTEAGDSEWQWHQLGHMQVCTSLQTDNHTSAPLLSFYRLDALSAAQSVKALKVLLVDGGS